MMDILVKEKLDAFEAVAKKYGETIFSYASEDSINTLKKWWEGECDNSVILAHYLSIFSTINGFDFDGLLFTRLMPQRIITFMSQMKSIGRMKA